MHVLFLNTIQKMRILVLFANKNVLGRCRSMLAEERILQIGNFDVCLDEATSGGTLYIKVKEESHFEHDYSEADADAR